LGFSALGAAECRRQSTLTRTGLPEEADTSSYAVSLDLAWGVAHSAAFLGSSPIVDPALRRRPRTMIASAGSSREGTSPFGLALLARWPT